MALAGFISALPAILQGGAALATAFQRPARVTIQQAPSLSPQAFAPTNGSFQLARLGEIFPVQQAAAAGGMVRAGVTGAAALFRGGIRVIGQKIFANIGRRVTPQQAAALARRVGVEAAAVALGISAVELVQYISAATLVRRRRRGITGRQIANARSTIVRMTNFMARVQEACAPAMRRRSSRRAHRAGCGCFVCRRAA